MTLKLQLSQQYNRFFPSLVIVHEVVPTVKYEVTDKHAKFCMTRNNKHGGV